MNTKQTVPLLAALPALPALAAAAPPLLIGAAIGLGLLWLFSDDEKKEAPAPVESKPVKSAPVKPMPITPTLFIPAPQKPAPAKPAPVIPAPVKPTVSLPKQAEKPAPVQPLRPAKSAKRRIMREDVAEALGYGAGKIPLGDAVLALQARGFGKTAAYKAFSAQSKFGDLIESTPDGLIEWKG